MVDPREVQHPLRDGSGSKLGGHQISPGWGFSIPSAMEADQNRKCERTTSRFCSASPPRWKRIKTIRSCPWSPPWGSASPPRWKRIKTASVLRKCPPIRSASPPRWKRIKTNDGVIHLFSPVQHPLRDGSGSKPDRSWSTSSSAVQHPLRDGSGSKPGHGVFLLSGGSASPPRWKRIKTTKRRFCIGFLVQHPLRDGSGSKQVTICHDALQQFSIPSAMEADQNYGRTGRREPAGSASPPRWKRIKTRAII
mgnify:CR=1 FL=1